MKVDFETDVGAVRSSNQDACDGGLGQQGQRLGRGVRRHGRANGGNVASAMAVESIRRRLLEGFHQDITRGGRPLPAAGGRDRGQQGGVPPLPGGAGAAGHGHHGGGAGGLEGHPPCAHVGDSRAYLKNSQGLSQITMDHSYVQDLVNFGQITKERPGYTRAGTSSPGCWGYTPRWSATTTATTSPPGTRPWHAPTALTGNMEDGLLDEYLEHYGQNGSALAKKLIQFAVEKGGSDNITVAVVRNG